MYRVLIVSQREIFSEGLRHAMGRSDQLCMMGAVRSHAEALDLPCFPAPDVVLYDAGTKPWLHLHEAYRIQRQWPATPLLVLLPEFTELVQAALMKIGFPCWLLDDTPVQQVCSHILQLAKKGASPGPNGQSNKLTLIDGKCWRRLATLTAREHDVVEQVAEGCPNKEIADRLGMSELTVKSHLKSIYSKLQVRNRVEATMLWQASNGSPHAQMAGLL